MTDHERNQKLLAVLTHCYALLTLSKVTTDQEMSAVLTNEKYKFSIEAYTPPALGQTFHCDLACGRCVRNTDNTVKVSVFPLSFILNHHVPAINLIYNVTATLVHELIHMHQIYTETSIDEAEAMVLTTRTMQLFNQYTNKKYSLILKDLIVDAIPSLNEYIRQYDKAHETPASMDGKSSDEPVFLYQYLVLDTTVSKDGEEYQIKSEIHKLTTDDDALAIANDMEKSNNNLYVLAIYKSCSSFIGLTDDDISKFGYNLLWRRYERLNNDIINNIKKTSPR